ncbi:monovalent cation/H(+) antiporter subunit G [Brooklawnia cerclae]|uniref:Multicomponent Na+:H+ antiporter subunit G n=1 Tax=Brooklawnia cerclae TaxID=349934 RepID=A0ABX0SK79_9ACTN|nr:monovalent cation/H(+) antiporter subunit G [Brooklawnia cerclae]NIH58768.1 multicomponent Na+:H+ antiporter subunit G [Brooklawnia cerclae]
MIGWLQVVGVALIAVGTSLTLITAVGMVRLASMFARMHAATKPQVLGLTLMCLGLAAVMQRPRVAATLALVVALQMIVAPISAHMLGRAAYRLGRVNTSALVVDEYTDDIERAAREITADEDERPGAG